MTDIGLAYSARAKLLKQHPKTVVIVDQRGDSLVLRAFSGKLLPSEVDGFPVEVVDTIETKNRNVEDAEGLKARDEELQRSQQEFKSLIVENL